jgi:hypothetical protein
MAASIASAIPIIQPTIIDRDVLDLVLENAEGVVSGTVEILSSDDAPAEIVSLASAWSPIILDDSTLGVDVTGAHIVTPAALSPPTTPSHTVARSTLPPTMAGRSILDELDLGNVEGIVSGALGLLAPHNAPNAPTKTALSTPSSTLAARTPDDGDLFGEFDSLIDALDYPTTNGAPTTANSTTTASDTMPTGSTVVRVLEQDDGLIGDFDAIPKGWTMTGATSLPTASWVRALREYDDGLIGDYNGFIDPLAPLATAVTTTASDTTITMATTTDAPSQTAMTDAVSSAVPTSTSLGFGALETPSPSAVNVLLPATPSVLVAPCMTVMLEQVSGPITTPVPASLS